METEWKVNRFHSSVQGLSPAQTGSLLKSSQWKKKFGLNAPVPGLAEIARLVGVIPRRSASGGRAP